MDVKGLKKSFGDTVAVEDISFAVGEGDIVGLLGPNGAGKTTVIRMILGIYAPDEGEIAFGRSLTEPDQIGYLPEDRGLYADASVLDCLVYLGTLKGLSRRYARDRARHWLKKVDLRSVADRLIGTLSKGMQQKIQFIAAVLHGPAFAILDEVFSGLDPINQQLMIDFLRDLRDEGTTLLVSSHQLNIVESLCRRVVLIDRGRAILSGGIDALRQNYGMTTVRLTFGGEADFLPHLSGVTVYRRDRRRVWLHLDRDQTPEFFLRQLVHREVRIVDLSISYPSLHDIFMSAVEARAEVTSCHD